MKVVILEVSNSCNIKCQFCYNPWQELDGNKYSKVKILPKKDFFWIIDKLKNWGATNLGFSGGEPLLNSEIFDIAEYSKEHGFKNSLLTNGMLIGKYSEKIAEFFDIVQISLHGIEKTHDQLTGRIGALNQALMGRMALMDYEMPISAAIVVNKLNIGELWDIIGLAAGMNMSSLLINRFLPGGAGLKNVKSLNLSEYEVVEMLNTVEEASEEFGIPPFIGTPIPPCLEGLRDYKFLLKNGCAAGKGLHCAIDPSGGLKVCNHSSTIIGNCLLSDPKTLYDTSDYIKGFKELRYTPTMCKGCSKVEICKGGCREAAHLLYGNISAPDPIFMRET
ncbi:MAG: radical SAM/SPASM domain-containing protein [Candidatus Hodarchaeota archaeon]